MRKLSISTDTFVNTLLPPHKRQEVRLAWLRSLMQPFRRMMSDYRAWRDTAITRARVTGETASLEWYLNTLFDPALKRIYIVNAGADGVVAGLEATEPGTYIAAGLEATEAASFAVVPLPGETTGIGTCSFGVFVPTALATQINAIGRIVRIYKIAGKSFVIKLF